MAYRDPSTDDRRDDRFLRSGGGMSVGMITAIAVGALLLMGAFMMSFDWPTTTATKAPIEPSAMRTSPPIEAPATTGQGGLTENPGPAQNVPYPPAELPQQ